jgi:hypothetical protein
MPQCTMCAKDYNTISVFFIIFIDELIDLAYTYFVQHIAMRIRHVSTLEPVAKIFNASQN